MCTDIKGIFKIFAAIFQTVTKNCNLIAIGFLLNFIKLMIS